MKIDKIIKKLESLEHQLSEIDKINSTTPLWLTIDQLSDGNFETSTISGNGNSSVISQN